jgi:hypothetical protein
MIRPGTRVRLKGLTKQEYNDREGTVRDSQRATAEGRLCIVLDGDAVATPDCYRERERERDWEGKRDGGWIREKERERERERARDRERERERERRERESSRDVGHVPAFVL